MSEVKNKKWTFLSSKSANFDHNSILKIENLLADRTKSKKIKNFIESDKIALKLQELNVCYHDESMEWYVRAAATPSTSSLVNNNKFSIKNKTKEQERNKRQAEKNLKKKREQKLISEEVENDINEESNNIEEKVMESNKKSSKNKKRRVEENA